MTVYKRRVGRGYPQGGGGSGIHGDLLRRILFAEEDLGGFYLSVSTCLKSVLY